VKRILFLASRFPYPAKSGRERTLLEYLSFLKGNAKVYFYFFEKKKKPETVIQEFKSKYHIEQIKFIKLPSLFSSMVNIVKDTLILRKKSLQESLFFSKKIQTFLMKEVILNNIDIIFADMIRAAQYFEYVDIKKVTKVFDMDDIISKRYKYLMDYSDVNILGNFNDNFPEIFSIIINSYLRKIILDIEGRLVERRELELAKKFDKVILVSPEEANLLKYTIGKKEIYYIYPTVKRMTLRLNIKKLSPSISFMGLLNVPHNEKALITFIKKIFPEIKRLYPNIKFFIVGANPTEKLKKLVRLNSSNIILTGYVENFSEYILKTDLFIAPIYFGTGIKTKILDAMSLGMPVITTPLGVQGLSVKHLRDIIIVNDDKEFVYFVDKLLKDEELRSSIGKKAYQYVNKYHNYEKIRREFLKILLGEE